MPQILQKAPGNVDVDTVIKTGIEFWRNIFMGTTNQPLNPINTEETVIDFTSKNSLK